MAERFQSAMFLYFENTKILEQAHSEISKPLKRQNRASHQTFCFVRYTQIYTDRRASNFLETKNRNRKIRTCIFYKLIEHWGKTIRFFNLFYNRFYAFGMGFWSRQNIHKIWEIYENLQCKIRGLELGLLADHELQPVYWKRRQFHESK